MRDGPNTAHAREVTQVNLRALPQALGELRDEHGARLVAATDQLFAGLRAAWDKLAPRGWSLFCEEWGFQWGQRDLAALEAHALARTGRGLRALPLAESLAVVQRSLQRSGLGALSVDFNGAPHGTFVLELQKSALAEAAGPSEQPRCALVAGYARAVFNHLAGRRLLVREVGCACQGRQNCVFVVVAEERRAVLEAAVERAQEQQRRLRDAVTGGRGRAA